MKITKGFAFESAHRLSNYEGKCERIHGHNYKGVVTIDGLVDKRGILIDFSDLKKIIKEHIVEVFDHRLILNSKDIFNQKLVLPKGWVVWMDENPTAENMADLFRDIITNRVDKRFEVSVQVFETDDSSAISD